MTKFFIKGVSLFFLFLYALWVSSFLHAGGKALSSTYADGSQVSKQVCLLQADDMKYYPVSIIHRNWQRFIDYLLEKRIKVGAGLICNSLETGNQDYFSRLEALHNSGYVELFNHGYDHTIAAIDENGQKYWEFYNTPLEQQKEHLLKAQNAAREKLGITLHTFGAPGNATDNNTTLAINEIDDLKVWLHGKPSTKLLLDKRCTIESPGGNPNYEIFLQEYNPNEKYYVLQCHPAVWTNEQFEAFKSILDYLIQQDVTFLTPYEYYKSLTGTYYDLTVESGPVPGVFIEAAPADIKDNGDGMTNFTRVYAQGTTVVLTAPGVYNGKDFSHWTLDGVENTGRTIRIDMNREHAVKVFYKTPDSSIILFDRSEFYFGGDGDGHRTDIQELTIYNGGQGSFKWTVSTDFSWLHIAPLSGDGAGNVDISVEPTGLTPGTYRGTITITVPNATNSPQTVHVTLTVYNTGMTGAPFGDLSTPLEGAEVCGSIAVTGWVLDDIGTTGVNIFADGTYIGEAVFIEGARPDIEVAYPNFPGNFQAGWGYMLLTNFLPKGGNGVYTLTAIASDIEGNQVSLGSKTIVVDNEHAVAPFGAIDTPTQGGEAAGNNFINLGWVLTPVPNQVPQDGYSISVYVDGVYVGHPAYNNYRSDIAALFPGYANSGGAAGYFSLDTTSYENGLHTIHWEAADNTGNTGGIGSRYFNIRNSSGTGNQLSSANRYWAAEKKALTGVPVNYPGHEPIGVKLGYDKDSQPQLFYPDSSGITHIEITELQPLEIHLAEAGGYAAMENPPLHGTPLSNYTGFLIVREQFKRLPIGSTLDQEKGIFYWQPGPGFIGEYRLVFLFREKNGLWSRKEVVIKITAKVGNK